MRSSDRYICVNSQLPTAHLHNRLDHQRGSVLPTCRAVRTTLHCDLGYAETTEELSYVADADCSVVFRFPLPPRSAIFKCAQYWPRLR